MHFRFFFIIIASYGSLAHKLQNQHDEEEGKKSCRNSRIYDDIITIKVEIHVRNGDCIKSLFQHLMFGEILEEKLFARKIATTLLHSNVVLHQILTIWNLVKDDSQFYLKKLIDPNRYHCQPKFIVKRVFFQYLISCYLFVECEIDIHMCHFQLGFCYEVT